MYLSRSMISILILAYTFTTAAATENWDPLTTKARPSCEAPSSCRVTQTNGTFEVNYTLTSVDGGKLKKLTDFKIKNMATGTSQDFKLEEMNNIDRDDYFRVYKLKLRPESKESDIAIHAYNSAREGEVFYYFSYDPAAKRFMMSDGTYPKLAYDTKTKTYKTALQGRKVEPKFK